MLNKNYIQVVDLFEEYYLGGKFQIVLDSNKSNKKTDKFLFPYDQFDLVTMALLKMVKLIQ